MEKIICNMERIYNNKKSKKRLILLINRYYLGFLINDDEEYLRKAFKLILEYLKINKTDLDMILAICFFSIELKDKDKIEYFFSVLLKYKKFIKNNDKDRYAFYIFLQALYKSYKNSLVGTNKFIKILSNIKEIRELNYYLTYLELKNNNLNRDSLKTTEFNDKFKFWNNLILYCCIEKNFKFLSITKDNFKSYLKWALYKDIPIEKSLKKYENLFEFDLKEENFIWEIYEKYKLDFILEKACTVYSEKNKITEKSYFFSREAVNRQLNLKFINLNYIKNCYKLGIEDVGIYPIKEVIKNLDMDFDIITFIYHIILSNKKYNILVSENSTKILQYGSYFLEKRLKGRYYYSIYKYMLDTLKLDFDIQKSIVNILYPEAYSYEITVSSENAKWIIVKDFEFTKFRYYEINDKKTLIKAVSNDFLYYIFDNSKSEILDCYVKIDKVIKNNTFKLSKIFYENGLIDQFVLTNYLGYFLENKANILESNSLLLQILAIEGLSDGFKMKVQLLIADFYFLKNDFENAILYYKKVPEKYINERYTENILLSYVNCFEYESAVEIIKKDYFNIQNEVLFNSVKKIIKYSNLKEEVLQFVYHLIINYTIDDELIEILIENYKMGLKDWLYMRNFLQNKEIFKPKIDEYILELTIYTHNLNEKSEDIFLDFFQKYKDNKIIDSFLNYCMFETFYNNYIFKEQTVNLMEDIFTICKDKILGYTLIHIYLYQNFDLHQKNDIIDKIMKNMEADCISFKIFENYKDKLKNNSYFYKNRPFTYNSIPNKNIYLFYKANDEENFNSIKMKYFKYGIYTISLPIFFGEEIEYYFSENMETGSIITPKYNIKNFDNVIFEEDEMFFKINNSAVYYYECKYDLAHTIIKEIIFKEHNLKGKIL